MENQKLWFCLVGALLLLLTTYVAWPLLGLKRIAETIHTRDAAGFLDLVEVNELKRSLAAQVAGAYLKTATPERRLPPFVLNLATRGAMAAADVYVAEIINAERLFDLLTPAGVEFFAGSRMSPPWWPPNLRNIGKLIANAEYRGSNFYLSLPLYAQPQEQYRVRLKLTVWKWKLAGIDLPEAIQQGLAQEFANRFPPGLR